jgi:hypothetical protein
MYEAHGLGKNFDECGFAADIGDGHPGHYRNQLGSQAQAARAQAT